MWECLSMLNYITIVRKQDFVLFCPCTYIFLQMNLTQAQILYIDIWDNISLNSTGLNYKLAFTGLQNWRFNVIWVQAAQRERRPQVWEMGEESQNGWSYLRGR